MIKKLFIVLLILACGCADNNSANTGGVLLPSKFDIGDQIYHKSSNKVGIIYKKYSYSDYTWAYNVLYDGTELFYRNEDDLVLFKKINWNEMVVENSGAELPDNEFYTP